MSSRWYYDYPIYHEIVLRTIPLPSRIQPLINANYRSGRVNPLTLRPRPVEIAVGVAGRGDMFARRRHVVAGEHIAGDPRQPRWRRGAECDQVHARAGFRNAGATRRAAADGVSCLPPDLRGMRQGHACEATTLVGLPLRKLAMFSTARTKPSRRTSAVWPAMCGESTVVARPSSGSSGRTGSS